VLVLLVVARATGSGLASGIGNAVMEYGYRDLLGCLGWGRETGVWMWLRESSCVKCKCKVSKKNVSPILLRYSRSQLLPTLNTRTFTNTNKKEEKRI
jgi:hypothetical protein